MIREAKMNRVQFGKLHKKLREGKGLTLRKYSQLVGQDPGNISRIERGVSSPPQNNDILKKMAITLELTEDSVLWNDFFDTAAIDAGRLPNEILSDQELLKSLPVLLRTLTGRKLTDNKINELIDLIKKG
jgi:transcriptional regulator with XRE-family HTH domain